MGGEANMGFRGRISAFRIQRSALVVLLAALGVAAFLILRPSEDRSLQRIRDLGVLRVGIDPSFPPFESLDANGQIVGFDADLAAALARRWDVRVQFESIGFDGLLDAIWAGRVDAVISALPLEPRYTKDIAYSQPYFEAGLRLVATTARITSSADLAGRTLALELGSDADAEARRLRQRIPALTIVPFTTPAEALQAVLDGAADAAVVDGVTARQFVGQHAAARIIEPALTSAPYVIALPSKARRLLAEVNQALRDLQSDGALPALEQKWFVEENPTAKTPDLEAGTPKERGHAF